VSGTDAGMRERQLPLSSADSAPSSLLSADSAQPSSASIAIALAEESKRCLFGLRQVDKF
jgi:hypothetical protein